MTREITCTYHELMIVAKQQTIEENTFFPGIYVQSNFV